MEAGDDILTDLAVDLVLTMMASASSENISGMDWWPRARSALETAADVADSYPQMISKMGAKLQIDAARNDTAKGISLLGDQLKTVQAFERFRALCRRDALYIVAMAQAKRDEQKKSRKTRMEDGQ